LLPQSENIKRAMKKGLVILGVLLLLLAVVLFRPNQPMAEMGAPSFIKILGTTTNASMRCCMISITNTTGGEMVLAPMETIVETVTGWKTNLVDEDAVSKTGYTGLFTKGQTGILDFPVPEGAVRWKLRFVVSAQSTTSRVQDAVHNLPEKAGLRHAGQWTSFGRHEIFTTGDLPP